MLYPTT